MASGGDVDVVSTPGEVATFILYLPNANPPLDHEAAGDQQIPAPSGAGRTMLVVEDNEEIGRFARQILEDLGYRPTWVASAEAALSALGENGNGFDAVFSDVVMPGMSGIALGKVLRDRFPKLQVILMSISGEN
jgi:PleD family two-component response regulator